MNTLRFTFCVLLLSAVGISDAVACRIHLPTGQRIANAYLHAPSIHVAVVTIDRTRRLSIAALRARSVPESRLPWRASATVSRMVVGGQSPEIVVFDRGVSSCDDGDEPMPDAGALWVLYYTPSDRMGVAEVIESYPLTVAMQNDSRLQAP